jgi:hypothetical protein
MVGHVVAVPRVVATMIADHVGGRRVAGRHDDAGGGVMAGLGVCARCKRERGCDAGGSEKTEERHRMLLFQVRFEIKCYRYLADLSMFLLLVQSKWCFRSSVR